MYLLASVVCTRVPVCIHIEHATVALCLLSCVQCNAVCCSSGDTAQHSIKLAHTETYSHRCSHHCATACTSLPLCNRDAHCCCACVALLLCTATVETAAHSTASLKLATVTVFFQHTYATHTALSTCPNSRSFPSHTRAKKLPICSNRHSHTVADGMYTRTNKKLQNV